jgi:hypothetical protein
VQQRTALVERVMALLPEVARDTIVPDRQLKLLARELIEELQRLGVTHTDAYAAVAAIITSARTADAPALPLIEGATLSDAAWQTRGTGYYADTSDERYRRFVALLKDAGAALSEAVLRGTSDQSLPIDMMSVSLGLNDHDTVMAQWFEVARQLSPGSYDPYDRRLNSLLPRWGGSDDALLAFGREQFARQEWASRGSLVLIDVHSRIAQGPPPRRDYLERKEVCAEMKRVFEAFLTKFPDADRDRSLYASRLATCSAWRDADAQLRLLGNRVVISMFGSPQEYEAKRAQIAYGTGSKR